MPVIDKHYGQVARGQAERVRERLNRRPSISRGDADKEPGR